MDNASVPEQQYTMTMLHGVDIFRPTCSRSMLRCISCAPFRVEWCRPRCRLWSACEMLFTKLHFLQVLVKVLQIRAKLHEAVEYCHSSAYRQYGCQFQYQGHRPHAPRFIHVDRCRAPFTGQLLASLTPYQLQRYPLRRLVSNKQYSRHPRLQRHGRESHLCTPS